MKDSDKPIVFVVDDDPMVRNALGALFRSMDLRVRMFDSAQKFLDAEREEGPSCLILDVRMPGLSGPLLQEKLSADRVHLPIIFLSGYGTIPMTVRAMKSGAVNFLQKPVNEQELLDSVYKAIELDKKRWQENKETMEIEKRFNSLTSREREVFALVITGTLNKQIAIRLGMSEKTVKVHRARVMEKMQVESSADLIRIAARLKSLHR